MKIRIFASLFGLVSVILGGFYFAGTFSKKTAEVANLNPLNDAAQLKVKKEGNRTNKPSRIDPEPSNKGSDPQEISEAVKILLNSDKKSRKPSPQILAGLKDSDKGALVLEFQQQPLTNKMHSLWALAYLGGDDVREEFCKTLEEDPSSKPLNQDEVYVMWEILFGLGHLANSDPSAFDYLYAHIKPESWSGSRRWTAEDMNDNMDSRLAELAISAIGLSGRKEADGILQEILKWDNKSLDKCDGGIVDCYFYLSLSSKMNRQDFVKLQVSTSAWVDEFPAWTLTDEGKKWTTWCRERKGIKR